MKHRDIFSLLFPPKCLLCRELLLDEEDVLCHGCREQWSLPPHEGRDIPRVGRYVTMWPYQGKVREALIAYKFQGKQQYGDPLGKLLALMIEEELSGRYDVLTYVPVSGRRKWERGYDQVRLLARAVGKELGMMPVSALKKCRHNRAQSSLQESVRRRQNVAGAYRVVKPEAIRGKRVLLLDDIITTGATVSECAGVLLEAGAREVICAAVAGGTGKKQVIA